MCIKIIHELMYFNIMSLLISIIIFTIFEKKEVYKIISIVLLFSSMAIFFLAKFEEYKASKTIVSKQSLNNDIVL